MAKTIKRTKHRLLYPIHELESCYGISRDNLPSRMELLPDNYHVAIYITDEEFEERRGDLFPRCPITGAFCNLDTEYEDLMELY